MSEPVTMTTWKRADGEPFCYDQYSWATEMESVQAEYEDADQPIDFIEEVWVRQWVRSMTGFPPAFSCQIEPCDENAAGWWLSPNGVWMQACAAHGGVARTWEPSP